MSASGPSGPLVLIVLSSISSYLPLHIFIDLHNYTLRYVHLGEWACPVREKDNCIVH